MFNRSVFYLLLTSALILAAQQSRAEINPQKPNLTSAVVVFENFVLKTYFLALELKHHVNATPGTQLATAIVHSAQAQPWPKEKLVLNKHFKKLANQVDDETLRTCWKISLIELEFDVVVTTGCNIYISRAMLEGYSTEALTFVLAHEMSHSVRGDTLSLLGSRLLNVFSYVPKILSEELFWLKSGRRTERLNTVIKDGHAAAILANMQEDARQTELAADRMGARLLLRAGYPADLAYKAILEIEFVEDLNSPSLDEPENFHPSVRDRLRVVSLTRLDI